MYTFLDTETTDLVLPHGTSLIHQLHIIEICSIVTDDKFRIIDELNTLIKPPVEIPYFIEKHTGITNQMVKNKKPFKKHIKELKRTFQNSKFFVAQNLRFDHDAIKIEMSRLGKKIKFPPVLHCCVEQSMHLNGFRMTSKELHKAATGKPEIEGIHRAKTDVLAMIEYYKFMMNPKNLPKHFKVK